MKSEPFRAQLADYILSGHSYLHRAAMEKTRFLAELKQLADDFSGGGPRKTISTLLYLITGLDVDLRF